VSELPANVIRLEERRRRPPTDDAPPVSVPARRGRHLRLVASPPVEFRLDVFLARGRAIMAEGHGESPAAVLPLHARPA
jgi:hypothetical protein